LKSFVVCFFRKKEEKSKKKKENLGGNLELLGKHWHQCFFRDGNRVLGDVEDSHGVPRPVRSPPCTTSQPNLDLLFLQGFVVHILDELQSVVNLFAINEFEVIRKERNEMKNERKGKKGKSDEKNNNNNSKPSPSFMWQYGEKETKETELFPETQHEETEAGL